MFILAVFVRMTTFAVFRARAFNRSVFFGCIVWTLCHLCFSFCVIHLVIKTRQTKSVKRLFQIILHYLALVEGFEPSLEGLEDPCAIHYTIPALFGGPPRIRTQTKGFGIPYAASYINDP